MFFCCFLQGIFISKISENGPAGQDGILKTGDKIMKVNFLFITSLPSKCSRPYERRTFSAFWPRENWGEKQKS